MPFGLGQFQNGHTKLGAALAVSQSVAAVASIASFISIEALRETDGRYTKPNYINAQRFDLAKWISAGLFYGLWLAGAIDANVRFVPERVVGEAPSAAPLGPLQPPAAATSSTTPVPPATRTDSPPSAGDVPTDATPTGTTP